MTSQTGTKVDYLKEDTPLVGRGQEFICVSFISPEGIRNCTTRGFKFRGAFPTYEAAQEHAKKLREEDPTFDIFVGEGFKWLPWDPNVNDKDKVKDADYYEEELQKLVKGYEENRSKAKVAEKERKESLHKQALESQHAKKEESTSKSHGEGPLSSEERGQLARDRLKAKVKAREESKKFENPALVEKEKIIKEEKEKFETAKKEYDNIEEDLKKLDENMSKLKSLIGKGKQ